MSQTFEQLGLSFPLFEANVDECSDYCGIDRCSVCNERDRHCFSLWPAGEILDDSVRLPADKVKHDCVICFDCLRAGKGLLVRDTELGMVCPQEWRSAPESLDNSAAIASLTYEDMCQESYSITSYVAKNHLFELLRTPGMITWQGERWLFCCEAPMTYVGTWNTIADAMTSSTEVRALREELTTDLERHGPDYDHDDDFWDDVVAEGDCLLVYVFQCKTCSRFRCHWDAE